MSRQRHRYHLETLPGLLAWLRSPRTDRGIRFASDGDGWTFQSYAELAATSREVASRIVASGVRRNAIVCIALQTGPQLIATLFGTMLAGAIPSPCAPRARLQHEARYEPYARGVLGACRPSLVIAEDSCIPALSVAASSVGDPPVMSFNTLMRARPSTTRRACAGSLALLQLTSGSTGNGRAVQVSFDALERNIRAIHRWLEWGEADSFISWLPLHHDMGMVGSLLTSVIAQTNLSLLRPEQFVRDPARYLRSFSASGGTLSAIPSWGIEYITRRVTPDAIEKLDFSNWRGLVVGAERIDARSLRGLHALLGPRGLLRSALLPAYGMAEASLAISGLAPNRGWTSMLVEPYGEVVGCGLALTSTSVEVLGPDGKSVPPGALGEFVVRGPSLASGYATASASLSDTAFSNGTLHTGDAGFLIDGQLFPVGRFGDSVKIRSRPLFAEDVELLAGRHGIPRIRVAALLGIHREQPTVVVLIEKLRSWPHTLDAEIRTLAAGAQVVVIRAAAGVIQRTSSGKPRRRLLWQAFLEGRLRATPMTAAS